MLRINWGCLLWKIAFSIPGSFFILFLFRWVISLYLCRISSFFWVLLKMELIWVIYSPYFGPVCIKPDKQYEFMKIFVFYQNISEFIYLSIMITFFIFQKYINMRLPSLSELTQIIYDMELIHLGSEACTFKGDQP